LITVVPSRVGTATLDYELALLRLLDTFGWQLKDLDYVGVDYTVITVGLNPF